MPPCAGGQQVWRIAGLQLTSRQPQRTKRFPPLGTKLFYHANSAKKVFYCFDHQHGCLVTWLQAINFKETVSELFA